MSISDLRIKHTCRVRAGLLGMSKVKSGLNSHCRTGKMTKMITYLLLLPDVKLDVKTI